MLRKSWFVLFAALLIASLWAALPAQAANPCAAKNPCAKNPCAKNPCAKNPCAKNPCGGNPCAKAAKNPCGGNPCGANPCAGGAARAKSEAVMLVGQVTGYSKGYLGVRTSAGKNVSVHVVKTTLAHRGPKPISAASIKAGTRVNISTQARGGYYKANFIYALVSGGGNPCGANPCGGNPCAKKNPCGANPCAAKNPCAKKNPCGGNPCAAKNPCAKNPCAPKR